MKKVFTFVAAALCAVAMSATSLYSVDFTKGQGSWTIDNKNISGLEYVWQQTDQYGMKASAYVKKAFAAESWLVSPAIDLTKATSATLTINQALNKGAATNLAVKVSVDNGASWENLSISFPEGTSWNFQEDDANLNKYVGKTIKLAFAYVSTTSVCPTWEIKSVAIAGEGEGGEGEGGEGGEGKYIYDENSTFSANFTAGDIVLYEDDFEEYGDVYLDATNADNQYLSLDITDYGYADGVFTPGVYEINDSYEDGTVFSGFYYIDPEDEEDQFIVPSFAGILDNEGYIANVWYLVSGTVTISAEAIVVNAVNSYGKSVTANIALMSTAVENTEANVQSAIKTLRNGQVLIRKNNKVYTILGQEVK